MAGHTKWSEIKRKLHGLQLPPFADVIATIDMLAADGLIAEYAIAGGVAFIVWNEPVPTDDLDVLVRLPAELSSVAPILDALYSNGIVVDGHHATIAGVPVHFIEASSEQLQAIRSAATVSYRDQTIRVLQPSDLVASWRRKSAAPSFLQRERETRLADVASMTDATEPRWEAKRAWHEKQRSLPLQEKIAILIQLQQRQKAINQSKVAMGLPPFPRPVWETQP